MRRTGLLLLFTLAGFILTSAATAQLGRQEGLLDPNVASEKELLALPHLDETLVQGLIARRPFASIVELNAFLNQTLKKEQLHELYGKLFIHLNLNSATEQEILLIPGVGKRMAHEFEEYRPYKSLEQFRREIGKYVNKQEVARLEQYVFVPLNLNTAGDEDILRLPGMNAAVLQALKAQRPYKNFEGFRSALRKTVDDREVTRLERYWVLQ